MALKSKGDLVEITVTNPVSNQKENHESGNRMALENIRNRMTAVYGPSANLSTKRVGEHFVTRLVYPATG